MLVLSRKEGESIVFNLPNGDQVRVCLIEHIGQQTKVGIDAPADIVVSQEDAPARVCYG